MTASPTAREPSPLYPAPQDPDVWFRATPVEEVPIGEGTAIESMIETLQGQLREKYLNRGTHARRDAHPKTTGLVRARFIVDPNCPSELRYGILDGRAKEFAALVRFSNGFPKVRSDLIPDVRGMAIKLPDVKEGLVAGGGQDFLLATAEAFFGRSAVDFADFVPVAESNLKVARYFLRRGRLRGGFRLVQSMTTPASPLGLHYFSQTPYLLGPHVVKYSARPTIPRSSKHDPWYLRPVLRTVLSWLAFGLSFLNFSALFPDTFLFRSLKGDLDRGPVEFEFFVQVWPDLATLPTWAVEDPTRAWPFAWTKVATLVLSPEESGLESGLTRAEPMTFQPWHALEEHRPLGGINRARGRIYKTMSTFRNRHSPNEGE